MKACIDDAWGGGGGHMQMQKIPGPSKKTPNNSCPFLARWLQPCVGGLDNISCYFSRQEPGLLLPQTCPFLLCGVPGGQGGCLVAVPLSCWHRLPHTTWPAPPAIFGAGWCSPLPELMSWGWGEREYGAGSMRSPWELSQGHWAGTEEPPCPHKGEVLETERLWGGRGASWSSTAPPEK